VKAVNDDNTPREGGLMERIQESPRTVSALIIILIVAAAIYAFSGRQDPNATPDSTPQVTEAGDEVTDETEDSEDATPTSTPADGAATTKQPQKELPQARKTDSGYEEVAQPGDGVTHLARRATSRWLQENQAGYDVSKEHQIYIEDYIQKKMAKRSLTIGEQQTISFDLVKEAVDNAKNLSESQLKNLSHYTYVLT
jgi:hypothetical protein